ncbi:TauD/TfdA family dioxygenase [Halioxenophilus sp. WMMB6]|uniref:TauD/TfdA dioxygenase family protein n=1 Tax=Halioxenophilus sp. WMMB6 TaxID=3073815 RepID=UPI00295E3D98|nr:TauD/TfdA family dioxygenase [Halioxenophilus sp. WMMB6]
MNTATATLEKLEAEDIRPLIGSRVHLSKAALLSGEHASDLKDLLEQRGVLVLPKINFTDDEQVQFTETLGEFLPEIQGQKVYNISLDLEKNPNRDYLKGSLYWHIDGTMNKVPIGAAILSSKVLPTWGGNTEFCNTYAAYDALTDERKAEIANMRVTHSMWNTQLYHTPEPTLAELEIWQSMGEIELPLVWTHKSGRKSLVLGNTAQDVIGKSRAESAKILHGLREWATRPQFVYSHEWSVGDTVIWDNTGTMHRAMPYDPDCGRLLHRTKTAGEEPIV